LPKQKKEATMQTPGMLMLSSMARGSLDRIFEYAKMAEERGLRNFLVSESLTDSLALTQHLATITSRIQVGTGITNLYLRHPLITALHTMTIDAIAPGRVLLGLGTSHVPINSAFGINMNKPLTALREHVTTVAKVFKGEYGEAVAARGLASRWREI
jgi:alkanesulfonate monooxygenase SsuD/methylene tetrahydromethanopterin reductase-like flavin-dependent oxidoreductase (luciferase family)